MTTYEQKIALAQIKCYEAMKIIDMVELKATDPEKNPDKAGRLMEHYGSLQRAIRKAQKKAGQV